MTGQMSSKDTGDAAFEPVTCGVGFFVFFFSGWLGFVLGEPHEGKVGPAGL